MNAVSKVDEEQVEKLEMEGSTPPVAVVPAAETDVPQPRTKRKRGLRFILMAALPLALIVGGGYWWVTGGRYEETENANLQQARVSIAADEAGRIVSVNIADNMAVKKGDLLFSIDPEPYKIALEQADAAVAQAKLKVEQLRAEYTTAIAKKRLSVSNLAYQQSEFERTKDLTTKGISTQSSLDEARNNLDKARQEVAVAEQGIVSAKAALGGNPDIATDKHPEVLAALAARDRAAYNLAQTKVFAPADGIIYQAASFKVGQYVSVGTPLFSLVETGDTWVEANFKETQLTNMKPGQKVEIVLDTYPSKTFEGTVQAVGAGTGAEFSLLPAQNATGNWVKVTQRIPVRVEITDKDAQLALRTGMSATVTVDTGVTRGFGGLLGHAFAADAEDK